MPESVFEILHRAAMAGEPVVLGVITQVKGSSPQRVGAKAVFHADLRIDGTLGGGCLEAEAHRMALQCLQDGQTRVFDLVLDHDFGWDDGLICGGRVTGILIPNAQAAGGNAWKQLAERSVARHWGITQAGGIVFLDEAAGAQPHNDLQYLESVRPPCELWIAGSGHIAQALAPMAAQLDFKVSIFDDRPELANSKIFPAASALQVGHWGEILAVPFKDSPVFGLIVTRGHKHDALVLESWIHRPFQFLGMIGSARKARTIREHFVHAGLATADQMQAVECPVGVPIGSKSVMEIAVSILARYIERRALLPG